MYKVLYRSKGEEKTILVKASSNYEAICNALDLIQDKRAIICKWHKV